MIDTLVGIAPGSALDAIRARRPEARTHAQASYRALFAPAAPGGVTAPERFAVGCFVAGLHGGAEIAAFYAARPRRERAPRRRCATRSTRPSRRPGRKAPTAATPPGR